MRYIVTLLLALSFVMASSVHAKLKRFGETLCDEPGYSCIKVTSKDSWESLFPDVDERKLVKQLNRMNIRLHKNMVIAIPDNLSELTHMDIAPFDDYYDTGGSQMIIFDPRKKAWGAYSQTGKLMNWGAASGGKGYCPDVGRRCRTSAGDFSIFHSRGASCKSSKYPLGKGGAPMPYCMFFNGGFAFHGSPNVPGYHASHGCVRTFVDDAKWLHSEFVKFTRGKNFEKTRVLVKPY